MRLVGVMLAVAGCYSPTPPAGAPCAENSACPSGQQCVLGYCGGSGSAAVDADESMDGPPVDSLVGDAPAVCTTWTAEHFDPCAIPAPMGDLVLTEALSTYNWDTDTGSLRGKMNVTIPVTTMVMPQTGGPDLLVASIQNLTLEAQGNLNVNGSRPLLLVVWGTATIAGDIEASATFTAEGPGGSGGTTLTCGSTPTGNTGTAGNGGGGGAFQGNGGRGGNAASGEGLGLAVPTVIRGGCAGGPGGPSTAATNATRGAGGGALQISARQSITITTTGSIEVSGGAGRGGGVAGGGGGGGGSGGYIGLDAPMVTIAGVLAGNGGSGGGGASESTAGSNGGNGLESSNPAVGGAGASVSTIGTCIKGGDGSGGGTLAGSSAAASPCGGGGGGGGAGYILIWSPTLQVTGTTSPPAMGGP